MNGTEEEGWLFFYLVALIFLVWWAFGWDNFSWWSGKIASYPVSCSKNYKDNSCPGKKKHLPPIYYMVNRERAEVVIKTTKTFLARKSDDPESMNKEVAINPQPKTLKNCSIFDKENWQCPESQDQSKVYFLDGSQQSKDPKIRFVSQWRYRFFKLFE